MADPAHVKRLRAKAVKKKAERNKEGMTADSDKILEYFKTLPVQEREEALRVSMSDIITMIEQLSGEDSNIQMPADMVDVFELVKDQGTFKAMNTRGRYQGFGSEAAAIDHHNCLRELFAPLFCPLYSLFSLSLLSSLFSLFLSIACFFLGGGWMGIALLYACVTHR